LIGLERVFEASKIKIKYFCLDTDEKSYFVGKLPQLVILAGHRLDQICNFRRSIGNLGLSRTSTVIINGACIRRPEDLGVSIL
jgi:hypothetical protein